MEYSLPSRELIADCVQSMVNAHQFDAMICIPNRDKIIHGMIMANIRLNIPTIFASSGSMRTGQLDNGKTFDLISVFEGVAKHKIGKLSDEELFKLEACACPS